MAVPGERDREAGYSPRHRPGSEPVYDGKLRHLGWGRESALLRKFHGRHTRSCGHNHACTAPVFSRGLFRFGCGETWSRRRGGACRERARGCSSPHSRYTTVVHRTFSAPRGRLFDTNRGKFFDVFNGFDSLATGSFGKLRTSGFDGYISHRDGHASHAISPSGPPATQRCLGDTSVRCAPYARGTLLPSCGCAGSICFNPFNKSTASGFNKLTRSGFDSFDRFRTSEPTASRFSSERRNLDIPSACLTTLAVSAFLDPSDLLDKLRRGALGIGAASRTFRIFHERHRDAEQRACPDLYFIEFP